MPKNTKLTSTQITTFHSFHLSSSPAENSAYFRLCKTFLATRSDSTDVEMLAGHVLTNLERMSQNSVHDTIELLLEILPRIDYDENLEVMTKIAGIVEATRAFYFGITVHFHCDSLAHQKSLIVSCLFLNYLYQ